jgi:sugar phosphate isomerase/epimerase
MHVKLSAQERDFEGRDLLEKFEFAKSVGFDGIELSAQGDGVFTARLDELRRARAAGVVMPSAVVAMPYFLGSLDEADRRRARDEIGRILGTLAEAGALGIVTPNAFAAFSKALPPFVPPQDYARSREFLVNALAELGQIAVGEGVEVWLEPLNRYEDWIVNTLADAVSIVEEVGSTGVAVIADTFHMSVEETDIGAAILAAGDKVHHIQLGDSDRKEPGHGHYDWTETLRAFDEVGYDGWWAMECGLSGSPADVLPRVSALLKRDTLR